MKKAPPNEADSKSATSKPPGRPKYVTFTTVERPVPHSSFYRVGGTGENPYLKLFLQVGSWISVAILFATIACNLHSFHHTGSRWNSLWVAISLSVIGAHSANRKVWPAAIVVWLVALSAFIALVNG